MVGRLFADHDRRAIQVAVGNTRKDRAVGNAKALHADHPRLGVDDRAGVVGAAHPAGAAGVIGAFGMVADEGVDGVVVLCCRARLDLVA